MATNDSLKQTLEHFKQQRQKKLDEMVASLSGLDEAIRQIQMQLGETPEQPADSLARLGLPLLAEALRPSGKAGGVFTPRPDEFYGMSQQEAAKAFLERVGHAVSLDDLVNGLKSGGCKVGGVDPKRTLYISLVRNVREFVPPSQGFIGLRKFYPITAKPARPARPAKKKRGARKTAKAQAKAKLAKAKPPPHNPAEVSAAVTETLSDHKARTAEEVLQAVEQKLGHLVKKIAVYGTLRKKDFEQVGDRYRLRQPEETVQVVQ